MLLVSKQLAGLHYMFSTFMFSHVYMLSATINHREGDIKANISVETTCICLDEAKMLMLAQEQ